jgi:hypothetical protein
LKNVTQGGGVDKVPKKCHEWPLICPAQAWGHGLHIRGLAFTRVYTVCGFGTRKIPFHFIQFLRWKTLNETFKTEVRIIFSPRFLFSALLVVFLGSFCASDKLKSDKKIVNKVNVVLQGIIMSVKKKLFDDIMYCRKESSLYFNEG